MLYIQFNTLMENAILYNVSFLEIYKYNNKGSEFNNLKNNNKRP